MGLVTRAGKESKLTIAEMDGNLTYLQELAETGGNIIQTSYFDLKAIVTLSKLVPGQRIKLLILQQLIISLMVEILLLLRNK